MSSPIILRNAQDAHVTEAAKSKNYSTTTTLQVDGSGSTQTRYPFIYFSRPFPLKSKLTKGRLRLRQTAAWSGNTTVTIRLVKAAWTANKVTWSTMPAVDSVTVALTKNAPAKNTLWDFDISGLLQRVSDGTVAWYGFRVEVNTVGYKAFYSAQYPTASLRPELEVQWSEAPLAPTKLYPSGDRAQSSAKPILRFNFMDTWGDTTLGRIRVQISPSPSFSSPQFDSGWLTTSSPQLDLAQTSYAGVAEGGRFYWRVQVADGGGEESPWSTPVSARRVSKILPAFYYPAPGVGSNLPYIEDSTPPLVWVFTGTQTAFQILVVDPDVPTRIFFEGPKVTSTSREYTPTSPAFPNIDDTYRIILRVWDNEVRESLPLADGSTDNPWSEISVVVNYNFTTSVSPVSNFAVSTSQHSPGATLTWTRSSLPDSWTIVRDGVVIEANIPPLALTVAGSPTEFSYRDSLISGRNNHTWYVIAVANAQSSANNPQVTSKMTLLSRWLTDLAGVKKLCIWNPEVEMSRGVIEAIHRAVDSDPVVIRQSTLGREGTVKGKIVGDQVPNLSADQQIAWFQTMIDTVGEKLVLYNVNQVVKIVIYDADWWPVSRNSTTTDYEITFSFFEVTR